MLKPKYLLFILLSFVLILSACSSDQTSSNKPKGEPAKVNTVQGEKIINVAIPADPKTIDPHFSQSLAQIAIAQNSFNGLVRFPPGTVDVSTIEGDLAEKWEKNDEATQWTFHLKQGVQWHKGYGEVTAEDVKASFERVKDPANGVPLASQYNIIEKIDTPDQHTIVFHLNRPDPIFLTKVVAYYGGFIINTKALAKDEIVGTGPFEIQEHKTQESVVTIKHKAFFRGEPKIDKVVFKVMPDPTAIDMALDNGEIQIAHGSSDPLWIEDRRKNTDIILEYTKPRSIAVYYLNESKAPFNDIRVRQAVAYALDSKSYTESMITKESGGVPVAAIPSDVPNVSDLGIYEYDIKKAKQLLKEAGYENGLTLPKQLTTARASVAKPMLFAQDQLKKIGIELPLEQVDDTTYTVNIKKGQNDFVFNAYTRIPHINIWLHDVFYGPSTVGTPTGVINYSHYNKSDELIAQLLVETDGEKASQLAEQIQQQIRDEYVAIPLTEYSVSEQRRKEVDLGYNNNKHDGNMYYYPIITENTDLVQ